MNFYVGLDGGSTCLKAVLLKGRQVMDTAVCTAGINNNGATEQILDLV